MTGPATSRVAGLEYVRGIAGFYVFIHHVAHYSIAPTYPLLARPFVFGQVAVMVFFVMSGFVIAHSTPLSMGWREYFVRRARRIYPLYLIAMALAYVSQCIIHREFVVPAPTSLLVNLFMLQDGGEKPGIWAGPFMANTPLWSLSYEWFFYMAFFPVTRLLRERVGAQKYLVGAVSALGLGSFLLFPNPISTFMTYFVLWWSGVELGREYGRTGTVTFRGQLGSLLMVVAITLLWAARTAFVQRTTPVDPWTHPMLELRHFLTTLLVLGVGLTWYRMGGVGFRALFGWGRHLEPISYAIYICHVPIILVANAVHLTRDPLLDVLWVVPSAVGIAWLLERRLQPWINRATARWLPPRAPALPRRERSS